MTRLKGVLAISFLVLPLLCTSCGDDKEGPRSMGPDDDYDGDGFSPNEGDCNDDNPTINPDAVDPCDGIDQNCDGVADELFDADDDTWTTCAGDCQDNNAAVSPGASETIDGLDNDCDGIVDNHTDQYDDDGDGYSEDQGDCNDEEGAGALIGPAALEVQLNEDGEPEGIDNDCDGLVDEEVPPCAMDLPTTDAMAYAAAMDVCDQVISANFDAANTDDRGRGILASYGSTYVAHRGPDFVVLATGLAGDASNPSFVALETGTDLDTSTPHPDPQGAVGCSEADEANVNDQAILDLTLQVPANAQAFSFDFNFMSAEFPEFVCTEFDDTFLALLESEAFTGNVSFDAMGNRVSINVGFFNVCSAALAPGCSGDGDIMGTGYEGAEGGGTGWLTTTAPVVPGEKIHLKFMIFDEGDHFWDSTVLIDNFRWEIEPVDGPVTVD